MGTLVDGFFGWMGAKEQTKAAQAGAKASQKATDAQIKYLTETRDLIRKDQEPWRVFGVNALSDLSDPLANFEASPDYNFRLTEGMKGVNQGAVVGGSLRSGAALKALNDYAQNTASSEYGNWYNRQLAGAGLGQAANAQNAQAGQFFAGQAGNALQQNAANLASAYTAQGNAMAGFWGGINGSINNTANAIMRFGF